MHWTCAAFYMSIIPLSTGLKERRKCNRDLKLQNKERSVKKGDSPNSNGHCQDRVQENIQPLSWVSWHGPPFARLSGGQGSTIKISVNKGLEARSPIRRWPRAELRQRQECDGGHRDPGSQGGWSHPGYWRGSVACPVWRRGRGQ